MRLLIDLSCACWVGDGGRCICTSGVGFLPIHLAGVAVSGGGAGGDKGGEARPRGRDVFMHESRTRSRG